MSTPQHTLYDDYTSHRPYSLLLPTLIAYRYIKVAKNSGPVTRTAVS